MQGCLILHLIKESVATYERERKRERERERERGRGRDIESVLYHRVVSLLLG